jgi:hypothetical protein
MLVTILLWCYVLILIYLYGLAAIHGLNRTLRLAQSAVVDFSWVFLIGMVTIAVMAMISQLFIPLGAVFIFSLSAGALFIALQKRSLPSVFFPAYRPLTWILLTVTFMIILLNAAHTPSNPDTGLYHAQTIRWYETYRIVPGLGNFQERYAFNSSWLVLNAALSFAFLGLHSFRLVNGILFLLAVIFFAEGVDAMGRKKISPAGLAKTLFLPLAVYLLISDVSSAGNDMPVSLLTWLILILWVEKAESPTASELKNVILFLLPFFVITVKLSSLPLLGFSIWIAIEYLVKNKKEWRRVILPVLLGVLLLGCWAIRSVILSGYLIFPISQVDLFSVDWKVPQDQVETVRQGVINVARLGIKNRDSSLDMTFRQWFLLWFERETLNRVAIYMVVLISPFMALAGQYKSIMPSRKYLFAYIIALAGSIFWFLSAPDIRFGYGFLIGTCVLALSPILAWVISKTDPKLQVLPILIVLSLLVFQTYILWHSIEPATLSQQLLFPADYRSSKVDPCEINNAVVYCRREGAQCQYDAFPCIPSPRPKVEMRGPTFEQGFRTKP